MSDINNHNLSQSYWYTIIAEAIITIIEHITTLCYKCAMFIYCACMYMPISTVCMYIHTYV